MEMDLLGLHKCRVFKQEGVWMLEGFVTVANGYSACAVADAS